MRYVLVVVALLSLLGLVVSVSAMGREPLASLLAMICMLTFSVAGGLAALLSHMKARDEKVLTALKDIATSNAAMSVAIQNRKTSA